MEAVKSLMLLAAAVLCLLQLSDAQAVIKPGKCPKVIGQSTLDTAKYLGRWYEYERFPAVFELDQECTQANYGLTTDKKISVLNKGEVRVTVGGKKEVVRRTSINGTATVPDPSKPAELIVDFGFGPQLKKPNYFIQETDYKNYSVVFSCVEAIGFNVQFAWILTRARGVAPGDLDQLRKNLEAAGVDVSNFFVVDQSQCDN